MAMPLLNVVTRFPNALNNLKDNDPLANFSLPDRSQVHSFLEDFDLFLATMWTVGGVGTPTRALVAGDGGILSISNSAALNDNSWIQGSIGYTPAATRRMFFRARASLDSATLAIAALGLQIAVAANNFLTPVNGIFFRKDTGVATMTLVSRAASVETVSGSLGSVVAAQQFEVAFALDIGSNIIAAAFQPNTANGPAQLVATITPAALPAVALGVVAGCQNGSAVIRTLSLDQIFASKERYVT
jgi:hypothetical protein